MPRRDGRGPMGRGSMTGRGMGPCKTAGRPRMMGLILAGLSLGLACWRYIVNQDK